MAESLPCSPETITMLLTGHTPTQNKRFNKEVSPHNKKFALKKHILMWPSLENSLSLSLFPIDSFFQFQ